PPIQLLQLRMEPHYLVTGQKRMEIRGLGRITYLRVPVNDHLSAGQCGKPEYHLYRRCLAGSVWSEEPQYLTSFHTKGKAVDRLGFAVHFDQFTALQYFQSFHLH